MTAVSKATQVLTKAQRFTLDKASAKFPHGFLATGESPLSSHLPPTGSAPGSRQELM